MALRAYVTSGSRLRFPLVHDARDAHACAQRLTPRRVASLWLAHERREGLAQHAPPVGGNLRVVARVKAGGACSASAVAEVPTLKAADDAKVPAMRTGTRAKSTRTDSRAAPATLEVAPDVSVQRLAHVTVTSL